jgi:transposase-like protein
MRRRRLSTDEKARLVAGWAESGLSRAEYGRRHRVSAGSLARWEAEMSTGNDEPIRFVDVEAATPEDREGVVDTRPATLVAELLLGSGARVRFFNREGSC